MEDRDEIPSTTAVALLDRAFQAERLGKFDEARDLLRRALGLGNGPLALEARLRLGRLLVRGSFVEEADAVLTDARFDAGGRGAPVQEANAIHALALAARNRGDLVRARELLLQSPAPKQPPMPMEVVGEWFHVRGLVETQAGDLNYGERLLFRAHQAYEEARHDAGLAEVRDSLANLLLRRGKPAAALTFATRSLTTKRAIGDRFGEAITLGTIGRIHVLRAHYEDAVEAFSQDLAIARELGDIRGVGIMLNSLGEVALLQKQHEAANAWYRQALAIDASPTHTAHAHLGLAQSHLSAGSLDEAEAERDRLWTVMEPNPQIRGLPELLIGLSGAIAWRRGDHEGGEQQIVTAIDGLTAQGHPLATIPLLYELRDLYQAQQSRAKAVAVMSRALDVLSKSGSERGVRDIEDWLRTVDTPNLTRLALERHVPSWLVEDILAGRMARPPSRKQDIAVLFCDIRDYTTLTEGLDAERIVELLNDWFSEASRIIHRHGGVVDKFIGDAVMALFGVPDPREQAAADAVRAALEMRDALAAMNLRSQALGGLEIRVGIGIDHGEAVVGFIGSHLRQSYTAIGDVVNTASRLETETKAHRCDILISQSVETIQHAATVAETQFAGSLQLKGKTQSVAAYKVLGAATHNSQERVDD